MEIEERSGGVRLRVRAQPRAARTEVVGEHDGALRIRLAAPPVDGEANRELIRFLARTLGVTQAQVSVRSGASGRTKLVEITGVDATAVRRGLGLER